MTNLLSVLLSEKMNTKDKLDILENEYKIPATEDFRKDVNVMCNLGEGIEERALARGEAKGIAIGEAKGIAIGEFKATISYIMNMLRNNFSLEQMAIATGKTIEEVKEIIETNKITPEKI